MNLFNLIAEDGTILRENFRPRPYDEIPPGATMVPYTPPPLTNDELRADIMEDIDQLERGWLLPRVVRDLILTQPDAPGYAKVKAIDDQIAALRAQWAAIPA